MKRNTRIIAMIAALAMLVMALVSCGKDKDTPPGMIKASDEQADFTLYVPEKWTVDVVNAAVSAYYSKEDPSSVSMMAWELDYSDSSVDDWWEINIAEVEKVFSNVEIIETEDTIVDGLYAKKYVYNAKLAEFDYTFMQVACVKNATVYLLTYSSVPENYETHLDDVASVISNVRIGK